MELEVQDLGTGVSHFLTLPTCFWLTSPIKLKRMCDIFDKKKKPSLFYVRKFDYQKKNEKKYVSIIYKMIR